MAAKAHLLLWMFRVALLSEILALPGSLDKLAGESCRNPASLNLEECTKIRDRALEDLGLGVMPQVCEF